MESMIRHVNSYLNILRDSIPDKVIQLQEIGIANCGYKKDNVFPAAEQFQPFSWGASWGTGFDSHCWFHLPIRVPEDMQNNETLELCIHTDRSGWDADNPQFLCYVDGVMRQAFDTNHLDLSLGGDRKFYDVYLYAYTGPRVEHAVFMPYLRTVHEQVRQYYYDVAVPRNALDCMEQNTVEYMEILTALSHSLRQLNVLEPRGEEFLASVVRADEYLKDHLYRPSKESDRTVICIGHTHIDIAWLWTVAQTREKAQRSFSTVIELMKRYPEYKFMSSQAFLYKAVKEEAPELYEEIKKMVAAGRWEVEGAMWVEADCNLSSGESLVRQILLAKNFFMEEFGVNSHVLWLPDVFGYAAAMPQILRKAGVDWFVTSKISWNDKNVMPYDLFRWKGIDGTPVNTYFLTAQDKGRTAAFGKNTTYVANTNPPMIAGTYNRFQQKNLSREAVVTFGFGDGGGGPTADMLEVARRQTKGLPGLPKAQMGFASEMLDRIDRNIRDKEVPEWRGELYLEFHRGTYTSNARNKKNNRNCEFLALDAEQLAVAAEKLAGYEYPAKELRRVWELMLVNQFHDIIPGSSIREVYEQCDVEYAEIREILGKIREDASRALAGRVATGKQYLVFNPHSFAGSGMVKIDGRSVYVEGIPPKGYKAIRVPEQQKAPVLSGKTLETKFYVCEFDDNWEIARLYDKTCGREVAADGAKLNQLRIYEDYPDVYDAWEIQEFSNYKYYPLTAFESAEFVTDGARSGIRIVRTHMGSTIVQNIWFSDYEPRIDFETELDWHSKHRILRTAFPVDINADKASFEIQFGTIERPTHKNTSWDQMKFETCAQKFADLSEGGYGVSLINDCKYGHDIHGNTMMLTLLKCPSYPNEVADEGKHTFTYSILPHAGALKDGDTIRNAYLLNLPMRAMAITPTAAEAANEEFSLVSSDSENLVIETVKKAEKSNDTVIRMYEAKNARGTAKIRLGIPAKRVFLCDLMENKEKEIIEKDGCYEIPYKPFEIISLLAED